MAIIGKLSILMTTDTQRLRKGLHHASGLLGRFETGVTRSGLALKTFFAGAAAAAAAAGVAKIAMAGSGLVETLNKVEATFGSAAPEVVAQANRMADAFGTSKVEFMDAASNLGGLFKNLGYTAEQSAKLSVEMVKLADDVSSFKNLSFDEALQKVRAGISGESEPLKSIGVLIDETTTKLEAMRLGLVRNGQELTQAQKVQARLSLITRNLADAQGDHAKTANEMANALRGLGGRVQNLAADLGVALQPVAKSVLAELNTAVTALGIAWEESKSSVVAFASSTVGSMEGAAGSVGVLQTTVGFLADAWQFMGNAFSAVQSYVTSGLATIVSALSKVAGALDWVLEKTGSARSGLQDFLRTYADDLDRLSKDQWGRFLADMARPPKSQALAEYFDRARDKIAAVQKDVAKTRTDVSTITPGQPGPGNSLGNGTRYASAAELGSREATNAILTARFGSVGSRGPQEQVAKNTAKTNEILTRIASAVASRSAVVAGVNPLAALM